MKLGDLDLDDADHVGGLLNMVSDPLLVSSFQSTYSLSSALQLGTRTRAKLLLRFGETIQRTDSTLRRPTLLMRSGVGVCRSPPMG